jgi:hypothetical protein
MRSTGFALPTVADESTCDNRTPMSATWPAIVDAHRTARSATSSDADVEAGWEGLLTWSGYRTAVTGQG